ncbi:ankyrin, partial [Neocallimastix californiae]
GPTPLHFAASNGHAQVVDYLLERGADPDIEDQYGCTPIDIALAQGYTDIYKSLM